MAKIKLIGNDKEIVYKEGENLLNILVENKIFIDNPCNGKGTCGKCKIKIKNGNINNPMETEKKLLTKEELENNIRLACLVDPKEDITVEILKKENVHKVLTAGYTPKFNFNINVKKQLINIIKPTLKKQLSLEKQLKNLTGLENITLNNLLEMEYIDGEYTVVTYNDEIIGIEKGDTTNQIYGIAIDIGTTTVVCELVNMITGEQLSNSSMINAQKHYGLDVLTRITYEIENPENGIKKLQEAIVNSINDMIEKVCNETKIDKNFIYEICVSANCTMMHMLLGVTTKTIGKAPYSPIFVEAKNIFAREIGIKIAKNGKIYCLPSVSSYIGADIVAGSYVCDLENQKGNVLFIDIGTNGEIVLAKSGKLLCCSCAAGPALEGMNISSGMRAAEGAIEDVKLENGKLNLEVIGNKNPLGICGSGILAVIRELLKYHIIKKEGTFIKKESLHEEDFRNKFIQLNGKKREFILWDKNEENIGNIEKIVITQGDIRQVQLAKGAILSGFIALLNKSEITMENLDKVVIAGQFGAHLPADSLIMTGILPNEVKNKLEYIGNSSKVGAYMALMSKNVKKEMEKLAEKMDYMELSSIEDYERLFSNCLIFPEV